MTKTAAPRVRALNLYTAEQPGEPAELVQIGETSSPSGLPAEFLDYLGGEEVAAAPQGEPMPSASPNAAPAVSPTAASAEVEPHRSTAADDEPRHQAEAATARAGGKVAAKYLNHETGESWSGRGLKPKWLVQALEDGRTQDEFLIDQA